MPSPPRSENASVIKKIAPGAPGTRRHLARHGADLVCVPYREAPGTDGRMERLTTIEIIVDRRPVAKREALVRVGYDEAELRARVKQAGGVWDSRLRLWRLPVTQVRKLDLQARVAHRNG